MNTWLFWSAKKAVRTICTWVQVDFICSLVLPNPVPLRCDVSLYPPGSTVQRHVTYRQKADAFQVRRVSTEWSGRTLKLPKQPLRIFDYKYSLHICFKPPGAPSLHNIVKSTMRDLESVLGLLFVHELRQWKKLMSYQAISSLDTFVCPLFLKWLIEWDV